MKPRGVLGSPVLAVSVLVALSCAFALQTFCPLEAAVPGVFRGGFRQPTPAAALCSWWDTRGFLLAIPFFSLAAIAWLLRLPREGQATPQPTHAKITIRVAEFLLVLAALGFLAATLVAFVFYRLGDPNFV
ncbi:MAG TPA: hypothetical protein VGS22_18100 [Thermoanaerobaculia bacterium]|jgi:hypothetical protein|nr:hypothetical protein [Thermoanaerobaculia bacterium]